MTETCREYRTMRRILLGLIVLLLTAGPSVASAYCCWNEAICEAVCKFKCCGSGNITSGSSQSAMSEISDTDLNKEIAEAKSAAAVQRTLERELKRRSTAGTDPVRVAPST